VAQLNVDLVAADRNIWSGDARAVSAPAADGEIGILVNHSPLLSVLGEGTVRITGTNGEKIAVRVTGGFLSVDSNQVMLVVDDAEVLDGTGVSGH